MSGNQYKFSFLISREKWEATEERAEVDWPKVEHCIRKPLTLCWYKD